MNEEFRVVVIGLDGATWDLIKPWADEGKLPMFKKLMSEGAWGVLKSLELPISSASWTTITTGVGPGKHGIFDFSTRKTYSYNTRPLSSLDVNVPRIWNLLKKEGKKSYVVNVPLTYPPQRINGAMISGFPAPEEKHDFVRPKEFIEELRREIDEDIHFQPRVSPHEEQRFLQEMFEITDYVKETTEHLLEKKDFDFLMSVFVGPDALGHTFTKYLDPNHPKYESNSELSTAILDMYSQIDIALESIVDGLKENDKLFLVSDHGFKPVYYGVALNKWLEEKGYLSLKNSMPTLFRRLLFQLGVTHENLFKIAKNLGLVKRVQNQAYNEERSLLQRMLSLVTIDWDDIDWEKTKAYSQGNFGQIFINLEGREPNGSVSLEDYEGLVDRIIKDLKGFTYKGERVFDIIKTGREIYHGDLAQKGPDIICLHSESKYIVSRFFEFGSKNKVTIHPVWNGTHDQNGIFLACDNNEDIKHGQVSLRVEDVTPTILFLHTNRILRNLDGKVAKEIFNDNSPLHFREIKFVSNEKDRIKSAVKKYKRSRFR